MAIDWDLLVEKQVNKNENKMDLQFLIETIGEVLSEVKNTKASLLNEEEVDVKKGGRFSYSISLPKLTPNETWGDPSSQSRQEIDRIFSSITKEPNIKARIAHVNSFLNPISAEKKAPGGKVNTLLNVMQIIEALQSCLNDYNESSAGFIFEGFMAALTGGKQITGRVGGTLPIEDFVAFSELSDTTIPTSLKLLSPNTLIHGSFTNLIDYLFIRGGSGLPEIKYLIALKEEGEGDQSVSGLLLYDFVINRQNIIEVFTNSGKTNTDLLGKASTELDNHIKNWQDTPEWRLKMFEILKETPGYTKGKGMFYTSLDTSGEFAEKAEKQVLSTVKRKQFNLAKKQADKANLFNLAKLAGKNAFEGIGPQWEDWIEDQEINFEPESKENARNNLSPKRDKLLKDLQDEFNAGFEESKLLAKKEEPKEEPKATTLKPGIGGVKPVPGGRIRVQEKYSYFGNFHEDEKRSMIKENLLMEAAGSTGKQWSLSRTDTLNNLRSLVKTDVYGTLNLSQENINELVDIYIEKLGDDLVALLETTKSFTENIGLYFTSENRGEAINANKEAITQGNDIVERLSKDPIDVTN